MPYLLQTGPIPLKNTKRKVNEIVYANLNEYAGKKLKHEKKGKPVYKIMTVLKGQFHILNQTSLSDYCYATKITF
jgi:hypothetical protein